MNSPMNLPGARAVFDNHVHLTPRGENVKAVLRFQSKGGTAINLISLPDMEAPPSGYYETVYSKTLDMANRVRAETRVKVLVSVGPYPLDYYMFQKAGLDPENMMRRGIDMAAELFLDHRINAMGELGRPHFPVEPEDLGKISGILEYAIEVASDIDCPLILHTEDLGQSGFRELEHMASRHGIAPYRVVKHHALGTDFKFQSMITKSTLATRDNVRMAIESGQDFMLETDFVDDPGKPDKVIPLDSVPRRATMIAQQYEDWDRIFSRCFEEVPRKVYGVDLLSPD